MVTDIILIIIAALLQLFNSVFSIVSYAIPADFQNSITYIFSYLNYLKWVFPVATFLQAVSLIILTLALKYFIKGVMALWGAMPFGKHSEMFSNTRHGR